MTRDKMRYNIQLR